MSICVCICVGCNIKGFTLNKALLPTNRWPFYPYTHPFFCCPFIYLSIHLSAYVTCLSFHLSVPINLYAPILLTTEILIYRRTLYSQPQSIYIHSTLLYIHMSNHPASSSIFYLSIHPSVHPSIYPFCIFLQSISRAILKKC